ncbi:MAG: DNA primase, partial [Holophagales bacterium]|nr:DNA primase [Holophagales bacterium]
MMRDRELVQRIKDSTNIAELVGQSVKLRQQGNAWIGLCPFHSERTASFHVIPDKGFYHCFGCNKHGDAFTWLMEREGLSFAEAKEQLAKAAGIELPKFTADHDFAKEDLINRIRSALETAQSYFQRSLSESGTIQDYLRQRGINDNFAREAGFGLAPNGWENVINLLRQHNFSTELIEQTGLAVRNDRGNLRDFMHHRLTIPIHDTRGRLVAFGGRALGDDKPKYLNTRETQLFKKSETLFGFHRAKGHMRDGALLVEGYFDVLQLHQEGINQAIAPLGTALTEDQLKIIAKFTKKIVLCFDGDTAGQRATERTLKLALPLGFDVRLLMLPSGEDPDTWCIKLGADAFRTMVRQASDWVGFVLNRAREGRDIKKIADRMEIFQTFVTFFAFMPRTPENWSLLQSVAAELSIPKHELSRSLKNQAALQTQKSSAAHISAAESLDIDDLLRPLIILCRNTHNRQEILQLPIDWWDYLKGALILQTILDSDGDDSLLPDELLGPLRKLEAAWAGKEDSGITIEKAIFNLEKAYILREI